MLIGSNSVARAHLSRLLMMGAALVLALETGAWAQTPAAAPAPVPRPLVVGQPVESQIDAGDPSVAGQFTEAYALQLSAGNRIRIDMDAVAANGAQPLDTYLRLLAPDGSQLSFNDDRGDGTLNSRLIVEVPTSGTYRVMAQGFGNRTGAYRLSVTALPPAPPVETIAPGQHPVVLSDAASVIDDLGSAYRYREFEFAGARGDRVYLRVLPPAGQAAAPSDMSMAIPDAVRVEMVLSGEGRELANVGGALGFDDPRAFVVLPRAGRYRVRVRAPMGADVRFTLSLEQQPDNSVTAVPQMVQRTTSVVNGTLNLTSGLVMSPDNPTAIASLADVYAIQVRAGERVVVTLSSTAFDPVLDAGTMSLLGYAVATSNNDSQGLNSRLEMSPDRSGIIHLRVRSTAPALGNYELRIERGAAPASH